MNHPPTGGTTAQAEDADGLTPNELLDACVMLVDDDPLMTELVQGLLEDAGYRNFVVTNDPRETLALMRRREPSIVLLDLMMPQMSGYDVLLQLRADPAFRYTPVIVLTAATQSEAKLRALQLGASDLLAKPVDESELVLRVRNTLAFRRYHEHTVNVDDVTGLPSRRRFEQRVADAALEAAQGAKQDIAVFIVNLPQLAQVRETMGQASADALARTMARRLEEAVRGHAPSDQHAGMVARLRGEEFGVLLPQMREAAAAAAWAGALVRRLASAVVLQGQQIVPTPFIGIAMSASEGSTREALLKGAEQARSKARETDQSFVFFSAELDRRSNERLTEATLLREAVAQQKLELLYQPKVDMHSGEVGAADAMVHWPHPHLGRLGAERFMDLAEELDLGRTIGEWMIEQACVDAVRWIRRGIGLDHVSVAVPAGLWHGGQLAEALRRILRSSQLPPSRLCVALTEELLHRDSERSLEQLQQITLLGVGVAMNEFGAGRTSLSMIKRVPARELKVAREIVGALPGDKADLAVARAIVTLGHSLGLTVVADGVDTPEQLLELTTLEYDQFQGPLYSQPLPAAELDGLLSRA